MNFENRLVLVSKDRKNWFTRVLAFEKCGKFLCWDTIDNLEDVKHSYNLMAWSYMKEIKKYEPFEWEDRDLIKGKWIRPKTGVKSEKLITNVFKSTEGWFYVFSDGAALRADQLLEDYEFADGSPCGKFI